MAIKLALVVLLLVAVTSVLGSAAERPLRRRRPTLSETMTSSSLKEHSRFTPKMVPTSYQELLSKSKLHYDVKDFMESCNLEPGCQWNCEKIDNHKQTDCICLCKSDEPNLKTQPIQPPRYISHY